MSNLSFAEKRRLQKVVADQQTALRGGSLGFKEKRQAQRELREALDKLTGKAAPADDGGINVADIATRLVTPDVLPQGIEPKAHVIIMNAPRPLMGDQTTEGEFVSGKFYAAIDLKGSDAARFIEQNRKLDAIILYPAPQDVIERVAIALVGGKYAARLGELDAERQAMQIGQWVGNIGDRPYAEIKRAVEAAQVGTIAPDTAAPHSATDISDEEYAKVKEAARYLKDVAYSAGNLVDGNKRAMLYLSRELAKSGRDTLLMGAFNITRDLAHSINNGLDESVPKTLRAQDMEDAFEEFPGLRKIVDDAISQGSTGEVPGENRGSTGEVATLTAQAVRGDFNSLALPEFIERLKEAYGADEDLDGAKDAAVGYLEANREELEAA